MVNSAAANNIKLTQITEIAIQERVSVTEGFNTTGSSTILLSFQQFHC